MSYKAIVARIHTREFPGMNNIQIGTCGNYQVIIGKEIPDGELGVFFPTDGQLSEEFATRHDLIRRKDEAGNRAGGMFEENRKVKAIKIKGVKSEGFWCPLSLFTYTGSLRNLTEGYTFDEINGYPICNKFVTEATKRASSNKSIKIRRDNLMFPKHIETEQFKHYGSIIPSGSILYISEKIHGTSFRRGLVLDQVPYTKFQQFVLDHSWKARPYLEKKFTKYEWSILNGTRNTIVEKRTVDGFYGKEQFRFSLISDVNPNLLKGEVLYGEIVGYTETGAKIMPDHDTTKLKSKAAEKQFGSNVSYTYGCLPGTCDAYIYRIVSINPDGVMTEYSWPQVVKRCKELGLKTVPHIKTVLYDGNFEKLKEEVSFLVDGESGSDAIPSSICPTTLQEGIVIRYEHSTGFGWLKAKGWVFQFLEGIIKEDPSYVDTEEAS